MDAVFTWISLNAGLTITLYSLVTLVIYVVLVYLSAADYRYQGRSAKSAAQSAVTESLDWLFWLPLWPIGVALALPFLVLWGIVELLRATLEQLIAYLVQAIEPGEEELW